MLFSKTSFQRNQPKAKARGKNPPCLSTILLFVLLEGCGFITDLSSLTSSDSLNSLEQEWAKDYTEEDLLTGQKRLRKRVGILFVVDTTYSMVRHLQRVPQTFKDFIPSLSPLNWKMAFTNADYNPNSVSAYYRSSELMGRVMRLERQNQLLPHSFLYSHTQQKSQIFLNTLKRYESADGLFDSPSYVNPCELPPFCQGQIRNPIQSLIQAFLVNRKSFKRITHFVAIILTNGDNMNNTDQQNEIVLKTFQQIYGEDKSLIVYSISIIPDDEHCLNYDRQHFSPYRFGRAEMGKKVHELVRATKGKTMNICDSNYSPLAKAIVRSL